MSISLLAKFTKEDVKSEPYPYVVIENALDENFYRELEESYPTDEQIAGSNLNNNTRYQLSAKDKDKLPNIWKEFVEYHCSQEFYDEFINLFGEHIPDNLSWLKQSSSYVRKVSNPRLPSDVALDCQIGINSPVTQESSVKSAHVDNRVELFAGLLYLRQADDKSTGGDLDIYKPKDPMMTIVHKKEMDLRLLEKVDTVPYKANTFVLFLCSRYSIHGVTPRSVTPYSRRLVNVIGELSAGRTCF